MRKIYKLYIGIILSVIAVACSDNLDSDKYFKDRRSLEDVFTDKESTEEWLAHAYSFLGGYNLEVSNMLNTITNFADDIYFGGNSLDAYKTFKTGTYDESYRHSWGDSYKGIRQASIFIQNIDMNTKYTEEERADMKAQARFVRAYYYWLLLRKYGPVPLLPDEGLDYTSDYDDLAIQRSSYDECVEYIESEMRLAAKDLPLTRAINQVARPTRGAALAARARALIYSASPINNPRPGDPDKFSDLVDYEGNCLMSQEYNEYKWARAAAAARDVMELPGENNGHRYELYHKKATNIAEPGYPATITPYQDGDFSTKTWNEGGYSDIDPYESYRAVFNGSLAMYQNPELIFSRGRNQGVNSIAEMVKLQMPKTLGGGNNAYGMTQKMCDAYYMANGDEFSREHFKEEYPSGTRFVTKKEVEAGTYPQIKEGVYKEYADREPRFYASVSFNGCVWALLKNAETTDYKNDVEKQVNYYYGINTDGFSGTGVYLRSGIGIMKYVHPDDTNRKEIKAKAEPAIRFAEILLIYAEALNELEDGEQIFLYGEPWSAGPSALKESESFATKEAMKKLAEGIAVFNDDTRDAVKGPYDKLEVPGFVNGKKGLEEKIKRGIQGLFDEKEKVQPVSPAQLLNYVSAHDNSTLWDKLVDSVKKDQDYETRHEDLLAMNKLAAAIVQFSAGIPFMQAGEEAGRTKQGEDNSYNLSKELNRLDWNRMYKFQDLISYYKGLHEVRNQFSGFYDLSEKARTRQHFYENLPEGIIAYEMEGIRGTDQWEKVVVIFHASQEPTEFVLGNTGYKRIVSPSGIDLQGVYLKREKAKLDESGAYVFVK